MVEYINLTMQGYKTWDGSDLDFDYAMNIYSQTNFDLTVLVCSTKPNSVITGNSNTSRSGAGKWMDISKSVAEHLNESSTDSDNVVAQMQELLENDGGYIELVQVPIIQKPFYITPVIPVFEVDLTLNFVIKINFAAGIDSEFTVLDAEQIGMRGSTGGDNKGLKSYHYELPGANRFSYDLYAAGYVGIKAGFEGQLTLSFVGLSKYGKIGIEIELGAYVDCYGYLHLSFTKASQFSKHIDKNFYGGYFLDVGIYLEINAIAESEAFDATAELTLFDAKWSLASFGNRYIFYGIDSVDEKGEYFTNNTKINIGEILNFEGKYLDITTGEVITKPITEILKYSDITFSDKAFTIDDNGVINVDSGNIYRYDTESGVGVSPNKTICTMKFTYNGPSLSLGSNSSTKEYKIYWANKDTGISSIEDFNETYKVNYQLELDDGSFVLLDTVDYIEAGETTKNFGITKDELDLYYIYGDSYSEEFNTSSFVKMPSKDTTYTLKATRRQAYATFLYYDLKELSWVADIRVVDVGSNVSGPDAGTTMFTGWIGYSTSEDGSTVTTNLDNVVKRPLYDLYGKETNTSIGIFKVNNYLNIANELAAFASDNYIDLPVSRDYRNVYGYSFPLAKIGIYRAQYRDCNVVFYSGGSDQRMVTQKVAFGTNYWCNGYAPFEYDLGYIQGWDSNEDGVVDYETGEKFPAATEECIIHRAIYAPSDTDIVIVKYNKNSGNYEEVANIALSSNEYLVFGDNGQVTLKNGTKSRKQFVENTFNSAITDEFACWKYGYQAIFKGASDYNKVGGWTYCNNEMQVGYSSLVFKAISKDSTVTIYSPLEVNITNDNDEPIESFKYNTYSGNTLLLSVGKIVEGVNIPWVVYDQNGYYILSGWDIDGDAIIDKKNGESIYVEKGNQSITPVYEYHAEEYTTTVDSVTPLELDSVMIPGLITDFEDGSYLYTFSGYLSNVEDFLDYVESTRPSEYTDTTTGIEYSLLKYEFSENLYGKNYVYYLRIYKVLKQYTVTLDANGGYFGYPSTHPTTATISIANGTFKLSDYTKYANYLAFNESNSQYWCLDYWTDEYGNKYTEDSDIVLNRDITLKAHWVGSTYIYLTTSDGSIGDFTEQEGYSLNTIGMYLSVGTHNVSELTLPIQNDTSMSLYKVTGWKNETTGDIYGINDTFVVTNDSVTLTAQWELTHVGVCFSGEDFSGEGGEKMGVNGMVDVYTYYMCPVGTYKISDFPKVIPVVTYNTFAKKYIGWKYAWGDDTVYTEDDTVVINAPTEFKVVSEYPDATVTITFDANGGFFGENETTFEKCFLPGEYVVKTSTDKTNSTDFPIPTRNDEYAEYEFAGWDLVVTSWHDGTVYTDKTLLVGDTYTAPSELSEFDSILYGEAVARWTLKNEKHHKLVYDYDEINHWLKCDNDGCNYVSNNTSAHNIENGLCAKCGYYRLPTLDKDGYYLIENKYQLNWFSKQVNGGNYTLNAKLLNDISYGWDEKWEPIGYATIDYDTYAVSVYSYKGIFDGQGHTIKGLYNESANLFAGFVGCLSSPGVVRNINFVNCCFYGRNGAGIVAGVNGVAGETGGLIENCLVDDYYVDSYCSYGSICSDVHSGTIRNCLSLISGYDDYSIPMANYVDSDSATIENCYYYCGSDEIYEPEEIDQYDGTTCVDFTSLRIGKIAYLLSQGTNGDIWGHNDPEMHLDEVVYPSVGGSRLYQYTFRFCWDNDVDTNYSNDPQMSDEFIVVHYFNEYYEGKLPNCENDGNISYYICDDCGTWFEDEIKYTVITNHDDVILKSKGHTESDWIIDEDATETTTGSKHKECTVCHKNLVTETIDKKDHVYGQWQVTTAPGCTTKGTETRKCQNCSHTETRDIDATGHKDSDWIVDSDATCTQVGSKHKECTVCHVTTKTEQISLKSHKYGDWKVTTEPDCTTKGVETRKCQNCTHYETRDVDALNHDFSNDWTIDKDAKCLENGSKSHHCSRCDAKKDVTVIVATGHKDSDWIVDSDSTCTQVGSKHKECTVCHVTTKTEQISLKSHKYGDWKVTTAPDCTTKGVETRKCQNCTHYEIRDVDALNHDFSNEWTIDKDAKCLETGSKSHHCSRCDAKKDVTVIAATGHKDSDWIIDNDSTCTQVGSKHKECTVCHVTTKTEQIVLKSHKYSDWKVTTEPDCTTKGVETRKCQNCTHYETRDVDALNHDFSNEWTIDKDAKCLEEGSKSRHCSRCEAKTDVEVINALGHSYTSEVINEANASQDGLRRYICSVCKHSFDEAIKYTKVDVKDENTGVSIGTNSNLIPEGTKLLAIVISQEEVEQIADNIQEGSEDIGDNAKVEKVLDITLKIDDSKVQPNGEITVTIPTKDIEIPEGKTLVVVYVDDNGKVTLCDTTINNDGTVSFKTKHFSKYAIISIEEKKISFIDVLERDWYYKSVKFVVNKGLFNGTDYNRFEPDTAMTRAMFVTVLWRMEGSPKYSQACSFNDVKIGSWYEQAVIWAAKNGVVNGTSEITFSPDDPITREQMATMMYRFASYKKYDTTSSTSISLFPDNKMVSSWAIKPLSWTVSMKLIQGDEGYINPQGLATRAEVATVLMRFIQNIK